MTSTAVIYESPDGGDTVYAREVGSDQRTLHSVSPRRKNLMQELAETKFWHQVHRAAEHDAALKQMLDQVKLYYQLKYQDSP